MSERLVKMYQLKGLETNAKKRTLTGHASIFRTIDLQGDVVQPGAFAEQIGELKANGRIGDVKLLWQHRMDSPIGKCVDIEEDDTGLAFEAVVSAVPDGDLALTLIADRVVDRMSFGFDILRSHNFDEADPVEIMPGVMVKPRSLDKLKVYEVSPVTFAAHPGTDVALAKGLGVPLWLDERGRYTTERPAADDDLPDFAEKAGRVLSRKNRERLQAAASALRVARARVMEVIQSEADPAEAGKAVEEARDQKAALAAELRRCLATMNGAGAPRRKV